MPHLRKALSAAVFLAVAWLGTPAVARADSFVLTLPDHNGPFSSGPFPSASQVIGTFNFTPPPGQRVVSVVLSGSYGLPGGLMTAPGDLYVNGALSRVCRADTACTNGGTNGALLSFVITQNDSIAPLGISKLGDGFVTLLFMQTGPGAVRLSNLRLDVTTGAVVPEPTTIALFGAGLLGALKASRRKRKA